MIETDIIAWFDDGSGIIAADGILFMGMDIIY